MAADLAQIRGATGTRLKGLQSTLNTSTDVWTATSGEFALSQIQAVLQAIGSAQPA